MRMNTTLEQRKRIESALTETCVLLEKEMSYMPKNQKADRIAEYKQHIAKLESMLAR